MTEYISEVKRLDLVGAGHFGTVYRGEHPVHGEVAIKVIERRPEWDDPTWEQRCDELLAEGQALAAAVDERVVRVFDVVRSSTDESVNLITEFCSGGSLESVYRDRPMSIAEVRPLASDAAAGLQTLHLRGLLHRDIKPGNVLVGADGRAKLGDFGLVTDDIVLGYASLAGYTDHLAPEVHFDGVTSVRTDIWAFGMTLFRLLNGHGWFSLHPRPAHEVPNGGYAQKLRWLPHVPADWRRFVRKCLHDDRDLRVQDADALQDGLARLGIAPAWDVSVQPDRIVWTRSRGQRLHRVEWQVHSARRHTWSATSLPLGAGRAMRLASGGDRVSFSDVVRGLENFFSGVKR